MSLNKLPESAQIIFRNMTDTLEESYNRVLALQKRIKDLDLQIGNAGEGTDLRPWQDEIARQRKRIVVAQSEHTELARVHATVRSWIHQLSVHASYEEVGPHTIKLVPGETHTKMVDGLRKQIEELTSQRNEASNSVEPIQDIYAKLDAHVDTLAAQGVPTLLCRDGQITVQYNKNPALHMAWVDPEQMKKRHHEMADVQRKRELMSGHTVLTAAERKLSIGALTEKIVTLERKEEVIIRDAAAQGITIPRRENASPMAILSIRPAVTARKSQAA